MILLLMPLPLYIVDAFTSQPFTGNPAAVCILEKSFEASWMQSVAAEMNLSETAFLLRDASAWNLRWFTPKVEVDLCGHATLASAHILWESNRLSKDSPAIFQTRSGPLTCNLRPPGIEMDFPARPPEPCPRDTHLETALGAANSITNTQRNRMDFLVELTDAAALRSLNPDFRAVARIPARGIIATSRSDDPQFDFFSRFFAPSVGVDEDPVTGSAHCCLAPYWAAKLGKSELLARQISPRGGIIRTRLAPGRVILAGQAVTVLTGQLISP